MNVNKIINVQQTFTSRIGKSNATEVFGYDDEISQQRRNYIREHYNSYVMPYQSIYESENRMSEYELNKMLKSLIARPNIVSKEEMKNIPLTGIESINETSYRGCSPVADLRSVKMLKDAGIRHIVDIEGFDELAQECKKQNLKYSNFLIDEDVDFYDRDMFKTKNDIISERTSFFRDIIGASDDRVEQGVKEGLARWKKAKRGMINYFTDFINTMQEGHVYIGCKCGTIRTDIALMLNQLFNPKQANYSTHIGYNQKFLDNADILYKNLTQNDKLKMGWDASFDSQFMNKLAKYSIALKH